MYAIVKTGGKQYKVAPGDKLNIEKLDAEVGAKVELEAICIVDGEKVEADPAKAAATKVTAIVLEQFKGEKQLVFKFKKRKNYKKLRGHRQQLTRVEIESVGSAKAEKKAAKKAAPKKVEKADDEAMAVRRLGFYARCGAVDTGWTEHLFDAWFRVLVLPAKGETLDAETANKELADCYSRVMGADKWRRYVQLYRPDGTEEKF